MKDAFSSYIKNVTPKSNMVKDALTCLASNQIQITVNAIQSQTPLPKNKDHWLLSITNSCTGLKAFMLVSATTNNNNNYKREGTTGSNSSSPFVIFLSLTIFLLLVYSIIFKFSPKTTSLDDEASIQENEEKEELTTIVSSREIEIQEHPKEETKQQDKTKEEEKQEKQQAQTKQLVVETEQVIQAPQKNTNMATPTTVNLEELAKEIAAAGEKVKELKTSKAEKAEVDAAVKVLLEKKQLYAENNDGIGIDGKPFGKKQGKGGGGGGGGNDKQQQQEAPKAENAAKKAAKKEAKKAAKAAYKAGGGGDGGAPEGQAAPGGAGKPPAAAVAVNKGAPINIMAAQSFSVPPMQMVINPNSKFMDRPVVALTMAVLTNTDVDLTITSDHRIPQAATLGMEDGQILVGDLAMARYLVGRAGSFSVDITPLQNAWMDYSQSLMQLPEEQRFKGIGMTLEHACQSRTYLVGHSLSIADVALFAALGFPSQAADLVKVLSAFKESYPAAARWTSMMATLPAIEKATQFVVGVNGTDEAVFYNSPELEPLVSGMNLLEGATPGRVVTRFPPEPSGYLHVGHAKAVLLNDYYANRYKGRLIVRFDDTNPSKEKEEFQQSIVEDLGLLGVKPDVVTYTSDYFGTIYGYALSMIEQGLAYMDDTPQEQMKQERADRIESKHRSMTPETAKETFELMCSGSPEGATWCLRAKIDMSSDNGTLRDPVLFRQNLTPHHRSGTQYKAYPTYDLACPIVDSIEGVTHALRTTEYNDRDEQYQWIQKALKLRRVRIHAFSRVNFMYTVLSKRKLAWFVDQGLVSGWDDARFPTVRGVVRRGVNVPALKAFIYSQGASRRVVNMEWAKFWAENKKEIDKIAKRFMAIDTKENISLTVTNAPAVEDNAYLETPYHPKDPSLGSRVIRIGKNVLLEKVDVDGIAVGEEIVLLRWGVVKITKVEGGLEGEYIPDGDFKAAKRKLSWMVNAPASNPTVVLTEFDHLVTKEKLEEEDKFEDFVNPTTMATTEVIGDAALKTLQTHEIIQLERRGYYRVDRPYVSAEKPIVLYMIPDGKQKAMSGLAGKLAHH